MHKITFTCETITPMFLAGADGSTPELRAPSIKGALRFWWRALNGHLVEKEDEGIQNLLREDERLFGGISDNTTQKKSSVLVRAKPIKEFSINGFGLQTYTGYKKNGKKVMYDKEGLAYLFYVLLNQRIEDLEGFDIGTVFELSISSKSENDLLKACTSFWLFTNLGGIGSRARRGAGSIYIKSISGDIRIIKNSSLVFNLSPSKDMLSSFKKNIEIIRKIFNPSNSNKKTLDYSTLSYKDIFFSKKSFSTWIEALDDIGNIMRRERKGKGAQNREERTFTMDTLDKKAAFGMPISVQGGQGWSENMVEFVPKDYQRRSSPIWITVIKNLEGKFHWVVTHLQGEFMPPNTSLYFKSENPKLSYVEEGTSEIKREYPFEKENDKLLLKFIEKIKEQSNYIKA